MKIFNIFIFLFLNAASSVYSQDLVVKADAHFGGVVEDNKIQFSKIFLGTNLLIYKKHSIPSITGGFGADMGGMPKKGYIYQFPIWLGFTSTFGEYAGAFVGAYYSPNYYVLKRLQDDLTNKKYSGMCFVGMEFRAGLFFQDYSLTANYRYNKTKNYNGSFVTFGLEKNFGYIFETSY